MSSQNTTKDFSGSPQSSGSGINTVTNPTPPPAPFPPFPSPYPNMMVSTMYTYYVAPRLPPYPPTVVQSDTECRTWGPGRTLLR